MTKIGKARHIECSLEAYHGRPEWSNSQFGTLRNDPGLFYGRHVADPPLYPRETKTVFDDGTIAHACLTAPGGVDQIVAEIPSEVLNAQGHRKGKTWQEWSAAHEGKIQRTARELTAVRHMIRNVHAHERAHWLLARTLHAEFTILWHEGQSGLDLRCRPDLLAGHQHRVIVVDYKTTRAVSPRKFVWDAYDYGYHRQIAGYIDGVEAFGYEVAGHLFITSDKSPAHRCRLYELPESAIELGRQQNRWLRSELARRLDEDDWSDPLGNDIYCVDLPNKAYEEGVQPYG